MRAAIAPAYVEEVLRLREVGHLSHADIAAGTGAQRSTVGAWLRGQRRPSGVRAERVVELSSIVERLAQVIKPTYVPVWLHKPLAALDDDKPIDIIRRGDYRRVAKLIGELEIGTLA